MSIQPYLDTYLTRHGVRLDTSSDRELMYALTAAVRDLQKPMGHAQGEVLASYTHLIPIYKIFKKKIKNFP